MEIVSVLNLVSSVIEKPITAFNFEIMKSPANKQNYFFVSHD